MKSINTWNVHCGLCSLVGRTSLPPCWDLVWDAHTPIPWQSEPIKVSISLLCLGVCMGRGRAQLAWLMRFWEQVWQRLWVFWAVHWRLLLHGTKVLLPVQVPSSPEQKFIHLWALPCCKYSWPHEYSVGQLHVLLGQKLSSSFQMSLVCIPAFWPIQGILQGWATTYE